MAGAQGDKFKVSVIVPVYNTSKYLPECLDSLVRQSIGLDSIQVVVVDDGSTDGSGEIVGTYAERYPDNFVCLSQANAGQGAARNFALMYCEGEYVGFMDSDDYADESMYEAMYAAAKEARADICLCGIVSFIDEGGKRSFSSRVQLPDVPCTQESLFLVPQTQPPIRLVRRELLDDNDIRFPKTRGSEDNGFHLKLAPFCKRVVTVSRPLVKRRMRAGSTAVSISPCFCEQIFAVVDDALDYYETRELCDDYGELMEAAVVRMLLCSRLGCVGNVADGRERESLTRRTVEFVDDRFPGRAKNRYLTGILGVYLGHVDLVTARLMRIFFAARYRSILRF